MLNAQLPMQRPGSGLMDELTQNVSSSLSALVTRQENKNQ